MWHTGPGQWLLVHAPVEALLFHVLQDAQATFFTAQAAVAPTAERRGNRELFVGVDPHGAGLQAPAQGPGALVVAGPDACNGALNKAWI